MKKLIWLLLFLPGIALSQDKKLIKNLSTGIFHIKVESTHGISVCGEESVMFYISNKRVYIDTYHHHFDLKVLKRKNVWLCKDKEGNHYYISGTNFEGNTVLIIDPHDMQKPVFILSTTNLCK